MLVRIEYQGQKPSNAQILAELNARYPDKRFSIGPSDTIVESYRVQPPITPEMSMRAVGAVLDPAPNYLERTLSSSGV